MEAERTIDELQDQIFRTKAIATTISINFSDPDPVIGPPLNNEIVGSLAWQIETNLDSMLSLSSKLFQETVRAKRAVMEEESKQPAEV